MAIWRSTLAQTAAQVAAQRCAADSDLDFDEVRDELFAWLDEKAKADDAAYETAVGSSDTGTTAKRASKTGGGSKGGKKGGFKAPTLKSALEMDLSFGAFEGVTLGELLEIDAETADRDYEYGDGERNGRDYLKWLASERNPNEYARARARLVADANDIEYED